MDEIIETVAQAMWESSHEGLWDSRYDCDASTRGTYLNDAKIAVEVIIEVIKAGDMKKLMTAIRQEEK